MKLEELKKELLKDPEFKKEWESFDLRLEIQEIWIRIRIKDCIGPWLFRRVLSPDTFHPLIHAALMCLRESFPFSVILYQTVGFSSCGERRCDLDRDF